MFTEQRLLLEETPPTEVFLPQEEERRGGGEEEIYENQNISTILKSGIDGPFINQSA